MESKALKLRLSIQENQALGFRHRIQGMEIEQHKNEAFSLGRRSFGLLSLLVVKWLIVLLLQGTLQ
jgi:hypothetical protein